MSDRARCPQCKRQFRPPRGTRRVYCFECRPSRVRPDSKASPSPAAEVVRAPGDLEVAVRAELGRAERAGTWRGQVAVRLAREAEGASGTAVSSLLKQLEAAMAAALDGVPPEPDFVDDLAARRAAQTA